MFARSKYTNNLDKMHIIDKMDHTLPANEVKLILFDLFILLICHFFACRQNHFNT